METKINQSRKIRVREKFLSIPAGNSILFKTKEIKSGSARAAMSSLNNEGYLFEVTEKGLIDEIKITRIK
ncbi:hypothetical protein FACS189440_01090 [Bacteroidia bacterium]|nr:hypothetical protein FACS189423_09350 [Bacteroidia bacterium]GHT45320.1 hypothetical protein FACS189440_01090 [Bacteroidia bacterium]